MVFLTHGHLSIKGVHYRSVVFFVFVARVFFIALLSLLFFAPKIALGVSLQWSDNIEPYRGVGNGYAGYVMEPEKRPNGDDSFYWIWGMNRGAQMGVNYEATIEDGQGVPIACGTIDNPTVVPSGTDLRFVFKKHEQQDTSWFIQAGSYDSPYGIWKDGAAAPSRDSMCEYGEVVNYFRDGWSPVVASFVVDPPEKEVLHLPESQCANEAGGDYVCTTTLGSEGAVNPVMKFAATRAAFYGTYTRSRGSRRTTGRLHNPEQCKTENFDARFYNSTRVARITWHDTSWYRAWTQEEIDAIVAYPNRHRSRYRVTDHDRFSFIDVPEQTVQCHLIVEGAEGAAPSQPEVLLNSQCIQGEPLSVSIRATDPDGDDLRYAIDWDANGSVDQFVPGVGYVASGETQIASRIFSATGEKTVRVLAQDRNGLTSGWVTGSLACIENPNDTQQGDNGETTIIFTDNADTSGDGILTSEDLIIRAIPALVASGQTSRVHWSAVDVVACTVTGSNGDGPWDGLLSPVGGHATGAIGAAVTYTFTCSDIEGNELSKQASVRTVPSWEEF